VSDKPKKFDWLFEGETQVSLINQPIDYSVDYTVEQQSAQGRARQRWRCEPELISGEDHE
jgi:hypothetical protein